MDDDSNNKLDRRTGGRAKKKICYADEEEKSSAAPGADGIAKVSSGQISGMVIPTSDFGPIDHIFCETNLILCMSYLWAQGKFCIAIDIR